MIISCVTSLTLSSTDHAVEKHDLKEIRVVVFMWSRRSFDQIFCLASAAFFFAASKMLLMLEVFAASVTASFATM